jgi:hypothetical protein
MLLLSLFSSRHLTVGYSVNTAPIYLPIYLEYLYTFNRARLLYVANYCVHVTANVCYHAIMLSHPCADVTFAIDCQLGTIGRPGILLAK